jgi:hypothetical protein
MSRLTDLYREFETAWQYAKAADAVGRYDLAGFWENRAFEIFEKIKELKTQEEAN